MCRRPLDLAAHQHFPVQDSPRVKGCGNIRKAAANVVAGAAVEPRVAPGMNQLDADPVPFPLGGIVSEADPRLVERMGEHERPKHRNVLGGRLLGLAFAPVEQFLIRGFEPVPHFFDGLDIDPESVGQRLLGEPCGNPDPKRAGGKLEDCIAAGDVKVV